MSTIDLLHDLRHRGMTLTANGTGVGLDAPAEAVTIELRATLADRRAEIVAVMERRWLDAAAALFTRHIGRLSDAEYWLLDARFSARVREGMLKGESRDVAAREAYHGLSMAIEGGMQGWRGDTSSSSCPCRRGWHSHGSPATVETHRARPRFFLTLRQRVQRKQQ